MIVTLDSQCGCGGAEIGKALAERLGLAFYDKEILPIAAKEGQLDLSIVESYDEIPVSGPLYAVAARASTIHPGKVGRPVAEQVYLAEYHAIQKLAGEGSCLFMGRCSDRILQNRTDCVHIFLYAPLTYRVRQTAQSKKLSDQEAKKLIETTDQRRKLYYNTFSGRKWGHLKNYHLCADSSRLEAAGLVETLYLYIKNFSIAE